MSGQLGQSIRFWFKRTKSCGYAQSEGLSCPRLPTETTEKEKKGKEDHIKKIMEKDTFILKIIKKELKQKQRG